jgi:hypothetical protein
MDHDSVVIPDSQSRDFCAPQALDGMKLDEIYLWGRPGSILGSVGYLRNIYRIGDELHERARVRARIEMKKAYHMTQHDLSRNPELRALFEPVFVKRLPEWNKLVRSYLRIKPDAAASSKWKDKGREMLVKKGYEEHEINEYVEALESHRAFLERQLVLFDPKVQC